MNLDEMKNSWNVLNERLEQNEILNKRIIEEMVASKTKSAYDSIYNQELRGLYILLLVALIVLPANRFLQVSKAGCQNWNWDIAVILSPVLRSMEL